MPRDAVPEAARWSARLSLAFEKRGERTVLASRRHDGPLLVQKALHPEGEAPCHVIVVHPPAGIAGGDELALDMTVGAGAEVLATTPGAARWYRSAGAWARQRLHLAAGPGSRVEWLPQESIVFDGALADTGWEARVEGDGRIIGWDIVCLARAGSGERFTRGRVRVQGRLWRDGRLAWMERGDIAPDSAETASPAGLDGHGVFGTMWIAAPAIEDVWLEQCRAHMPRSGEAAVTRLPGLLLVRYRGDSSEAARAHFAALWRALREPVLGRVAVDPRIWST